MSAWSGIRDWCCARRLTRYRLLAILSAALLGCRPPPAEAPKSTPPAVVDKPTKEGDLSTVRLTAEAESRLGILTVPVEQKELQQQRTLGGEIMAPFGASVVLSAPFAGTVRQGSAKLRPGRIVKENDAILTLEPLLPAEARAALLVSRSETEGTLVAAKVHADAAKASLARAEQLFRDQAGSQRAMEETRAQYEIAQADVKAATVKRELYTRLLGELTTSEVAPHALEIPSPLEAIVTKIFAVPGQLVGAGAPLVELLGGGRLWIRVPVYVGDLPQFAPEHEVHVGGFGAGAPVATARPVPGPPTADSLASTVDLYFELADAESDGQASQVKQTSNGDRRFAPGQRVAVTLPLRGHEHSLVVPWSSVLHDNQGGTWVYELTAPRTYARRRVHVRFVLGPLASLESGPKPGAPVVTDGAAELFGTEFGAGK